MRRLPLLAVSLAVALAPALAAGQQESDEPSPDEPPRPAGERSQPDRRPDQNRTDEDETDADESDDSDDSAPDEQQPDDPESNERRSDATEQSKQQSERKPALAQQQDEPDPPGEQTDPPDEQTDPPDEQTPAADADDDGTDDDAEDGADGEGEGDDADDEELIEYEHLVEDFALRGYGAAELKIAEITGNVGAYFGARAGLIFEEVLGFGIGAYGLSNSPDDVPEVEGNRPVIGVGYGGPFVEGLLFPRSILHGVVGGLFGIGNVSYTTQSENILARRADNGFVVIDLWAAAELNVTDFLQAGAGLGWRATMGAELPELDDSDLSSPTGRLYLKFGKF